MILMWISFTSTYEIYFGDYLPGMLKEESVDAD